MRAIFLSTWLSGTCVASQLWVQEGSEPLLERGKKLASKLEKELGRDDVELERLKLVYNLDPDQFETRLIALSTTQPATRHVREVISNKYDVEHPTLLGYELLAHLLKHRFIDAIISFNFDELLDRSLDDELERTEFRRVVSERDCNKIQADPTAPDYVPLYVKLHGTASEPDSLRFSRESYYAIPSRIQGVVRALLRAEHCVIANVGFGLASFDFQRLLVMPRKLEIFNLSATSIKATVRDKIGEERTKASGKPGKKRKKGSSGRGSREGRSGSSLRIRECNESDVKCDALLKRLTDELQHQANMGARANHSVNVTARDLVQFRSVRRHEAVAQLLGPDTLHPEWAATADWSERQRIEYARRRAILELAFTGAKTRGLLSLGALADVPRDVANVVVG